MSRLSLPSVREAVWVLVLSVLFLFTFLFTH